MTTSSNILLLDISPYIFKRADRGIHLDGKYLNVFCEGDGANGTRVAEYKVLGQYACIDTGFKKPEEVKQEAVTTTIVRTEYVEKPLDPGMAMAIVGIAIVSFLVGGILGVLASKD